MTQINYEKEPQTMLENQYEVLYTQLDEYNKEVEISTMYFAHCETWFHKLQFIQQSFTKEDIHKMFVANRELNAQYLEEKYQQCNGSLLLLLNWFKSSEKYTSVIEKWIRGRWQCFTNADMCFLDDMRIFLKIFYWIDIAYYSGYTLSRCLKGTNEQTKRENMYQLHKQLSMTGSSILLHYSLKDHIDLYIFLVDAYCKYSQ